MMSKLNIDKINDPGAIRAALQSGVPSADKIKVDSADTKTGLGGDKLEFSERAEAIGKMVDQIKQMPDVREAKVNELRGQIQSGDYNPTGEQIADAILREE